MGPFIYVLYPFPATELSTLFVKYVTFKLAFNFEIFMYINK